MPVNLDVALLRTFIAVSNHGSMTAASRTLHLTQGAVSQQVARLEAALGGPLLIRDRRGVRLTPDGERLVGRARAMLEINDDIVSDTSRTPAGGRVVLGVPDDLVATVAPVVKVFAEDHPRAELTLVSAPSSTLVAEVGQGAVDVAVVEETLDAASADVVTVDPLVWVGVPGGRAHTARPLPLSLVSPDCAFRPAVLAALQQDGRDWRAIFENGSLEATLATVRVGLAVTVSLRSTVPTDLTILDRRAGLPTLPSFALTLRLVPDPSPLASELADRLRVGVARGPTTDVAPPAPVT